MIEMLRALIGQQVSLMLTGSQPSWFGPYELVGVVGSDDTGAVLIPAAVVQGSRRYMINIDHIIVAFAEHE